MYYCWVEEKEEFNVLVVDDNVDRNKNQIQLSHHYTEIR